MKTMIKTFLGSTIALAFAAGCASQPLTLSSVGPQPANTKPVSNQGGLQVFTDLEMHQVGEGTYYYPHAGYTVYSDSGARVKSV